MALGEPWGFCSVNSSVRVFSFSVTDDNFHGDCNSASYRRQGALISSLAVTQCSHEEHCQQISGKGNLGQSVLWKTIGGELI